MKYLFLILFQLIVGSCFTQPTFSNRHGIEIDLEFFSNIVDTGDGFVLVLEDNNINYEDDEYAILRNHLIKYNYSGDVVLENIHYEYDSLFALVNGHNLMKTTLDNGFVIGCRLRKRDTTVTTNFYSLSQKAAIIKYDENLEKEWMLVIGEGWENPGTQYIGNAVWQMPDGSYYLVGGRLKNSNLESMLIKVTVNGDLEWVQYIDVIANNEHGHNIVVINDIIFITVERYFTLSDPPISRMFLKLNLEGEVLDIVNTTDEGMHTSKGLALLDDESIASVSIIDDYTFRFDRYNSELDELYVDEFMVEEDIPNTFRYTGVEQDDNGDIITVGSSVNNDMGKFGFMRKYSISGEVLWTRRYQYIAEQLANQELFDVIATSDGGYAACGIVAASWAGIVSDGWVIKVDSMGCLVPGCDSLDVSVPELNNPDIDQAWFSVGPNPAPKDGILNVYCIGSMDVRKNSIKSRIFVMYDLQGKLVKEFDVEDLSMTYIITLQDVPAGTYVLSLLENGRALQSEQIVVLD